MKTTLDTMLKTCRRTSLSITRVRAYDEGKNRFLDMDNYLQQIQTTLLGLQHQIESLQEEVEK